MSDRIAVMYGGTVVATLNRAEATQQNILALALGHELSEVKAQAKATNCRNESQSLQT